MIGNLNDRPESPVFLYNGSGSVSVTPAEYKEQPKVLELHRKGARDVSEVPVRRQVRIKVVVGESEESHRQGSPWRKEHTGQSNLGAGRSSSDGCDLRRRRPLGCREANSPTTVQYSTISSEGFSVPSMPSRAGRLASPCGELPAPVGKYGFTSRRIPNLWHAQCLDPSSGGGDGDPAGPVCLSCLSRCVQFGQDPIGGEPSGIGYPMCKRPASKQDLSRGDE